MNKISNINILGNVNFTELKELDLSNNNISDIKVLEKEKFEKIKKLNLRENNIYPQYFSSILKLMIHL